MGNSIFHSLGIGLEFSNSVALKLESDFPLDSHCVGKREFCNYREKSWNSSVPPLGNTLKDLTQVLFRELFGVKQEVGSEKETFRRVRF